jgi:hypothetical protein
MGMFVSTSFSSFFALLLLLSNSAVLAVVVDALDDSAEFVWLSQLALPPLSELFSSKRLLDAPKKARGVLMVDAISPSGFDDVDDRRLSWGSGPFSLVGTEDPS